MYTTKVTFYLYPTDKTQFMLLCAANNSF